MSICQWPEMERPREKLLARGGATLSDAELLAIFLRTGVPGVTAVDMARQMLGRHGGLRSLLDAEPAALYRQRGFGESKLAQMLAALELGKRYLQAGLERSSVLDSAAATQQYLSARLRGCAHEVFAVLFLDQQHRLLVCEEMFRGTINGASVHPREVVKAALRHNAAAVILAHNHPSGVAEPSRADRQITERLMAALALVDVRVLDHVVVGEGAVVSFAERGLL